MIALLKKIRVILANWWSEFTLQTKLMAAATLAVSLIMSGLTFWVVISIQQDARLSDTRFGRELGWLLVSDVAPLMAEDKLAEVTHFSQRFYEGTDNIRYMLYADKEGTIFFGLPFWDSEVQSSLEIKRRMQLPEGFGKGSDGALVRQHQAPNGDVTDVFVPITYEGKYLGVLALGINPNPTVVTSSHLTRDVTIAVFISIWVMVILGGVFNALTITKPIKELLVGVKSIAAGNFKLRIDLPLGGELAELIGSFNEMAERLERYEEQNIEELTAEKVKLETLVSTIADGAVLLDTDLRIILANPTAQQIFGWEEKSVVGLNVLDKLPALVQVKLTRPLHEVATGKMPTATKDGAEFRITLTEPVNRTIRILLTTLLSRRTSGEESLCGTCIHDRDNVCTNLDRPHAHECLLYEHHTSEDIAEEYRESLKGIAITVQDITREVELNEAKSQFISNVSHELRTPLFNIKGFIETLYEYGEELTDAERMDFLETANRETDRLTRLVNDVLDLSRLESSCRIYHFNGVDIAQPIEQTLRNYQLHAKDKGIKLRHEIEPDLPLVSGNYDLLLQVFTNLVGNGLKFTPPGGEVAIRAYLLRSGFDGELISPKEGRVLRIEVSDTGVGIDKPDQEAIFDRFFRVENRVHTLEGTGLGLAIVQNIMEKHNTRIQLVSEVGVGTTFWFDLAVYQEKQLSAEDAILGRSADRLPDPVS